MRDRAVITAVVAGAIAFGVGCLIYAGVLFLRPFQPEEGPRFTSADGSKSIVVMIGRNGIDSTYHLEYRHGSATRQVGCVNGDWAGEPAITWLDDDRATLQVEAGGVTLTSELTLNDDVTYNPQLEILSSC